MQDRKRAAESLKEPALIPFVEPGPDKNTNAGMEGAAADAVGNVYRGETTTQALKKYVKNTGNL